MTDQELNLVASLSISQAKTGEQIRKNNEGTKALIEQTDKRLEKRLARLDIHLGGVTKSQGKVTKEFFYNSLRGNKTVANIQYDTIFKNLKKNMFNMSDEYNMLLVNGKDILIVETKYRAKTKDLSKLIKKKYETFKKLFPEYKNYNHHLALVSFHIEDNVKDKALKNGVLVLQRKGKLIENFVSLSEPI